MNYILILISLIQLLLQNSAHEIKLFKKCPKPNVVTNFDYNKMLGKWYVIQKTKSLSTCMTLDFKNDKNNKFSVVESCKPMGISLPNIIEYFRQEGKLKVPNANYPAKMTVAYPFSLIPYTNVDFWVVDTDYTSFAVTWSCRSIGIGSRQSAMILSRNIVLDQDVVHNLRNKLQSYDINKNALSIMKQRGCARKVVSKPDNNPHVTETYTTTVTARPKTTTQTETVTTVTSETQTSTETQTTTHTVTTTTMPAREPATTTTAAREPATTTTAAREPATTTTAAREPATTTTAARKPVTSTPASTKPDGMDDDKNRV